MPNEDILFQMASDNFGSREDFDNLLNQEGGKDAIYSIVQDNFGSRKDFDDLYGASSTDSEVGKPMPSVQTNIGGAEQKPTTLKPATQSPLQSSGIQSISERLIKTPSSYYTQKITEDITLPQARYVVSSMGYSMNDISNEELTDVLANKESYRSLGHMVDDVKGRIAQNRQTQAEEAVQPEGGRVTKTTKSVLGKEVKKEPMVMAPKDPFGFESVIKEVESPERPKSAVLQSYDNDQRATIDAEKNMRDWQKISESPINPQSGELKPESVRKQERAVFEGYQRDFQRLSQRSTKSLEQAKPVIDQYADALTDGVKWQSFQNKEGNFDAYKINDAAKRIAKESGFSDDGPAVKYIEDQIKAKSQFKKIQPEIEARYAEKQQEILGGLEADQAKVAEEFKGVSKTLAETNLQIEGLATEVSALIASEADPIRKDYELSTSDIKTGYDASDKDLQNQINQNAQLYKSGQITFEQATQNEQQLNAQREELSNQTNIELGNQFDLLTSRLNEVNSKYKQRYERQKNEIASAAEAKFQKEFQQFAKDKNLTEDAMIKLKAAYKDAYDATILADKEKRQAFEKEIGEGLFRVPEFRKFARSIFGQDGEYFQTSYLLPINTKVAGIAFENSLGTALEAIGNEMGFEAMRIAGKQMALSSDLLAPKEDISWGDLGDWISFQKSAGNLAGSMAPSLLATAVATTATGGLGLGAVGAATIGALAGWQTESMQMASQVYLDTLKETGDAVLAQRRADNMWDFQKSIIFSYGLEALPFMGILKKGTSQIVQRVALGAAAELGTETVIQEFPQTVAEEAIMKDQNAMKAVGNAYKGVAGYLASKVGGDAPTEQEVKDYQLFKRVVIETAPVAVLGGGGQAISSLREQRVMDAAEKVGKAYMQKAVFGSVSPIQTNQFLSDLVSVKGVDFATTMVTGLFTSGQITEVEKNKMLDGISKSETIIDTAKRQKMNKTEASVFSFLNFLNDDMVGQIEQESDPNVKSALESKQKAIETDLKNFLITKKSDLFIVEYADGSQTLMAPDDITTLSQNEAFINELRDGSLSIKGLSAEFTSKQKPIVDDINARMEASKQAAPEAAAEKPMKTLEDEISVGDTVDLTPKTETTKPTEATTTTSPAEKPTIELPKVKDEVNNTPVTDRDANNQDVTRYIPFSIVEAANKNDKRSGQTAKQIADRGGYSVKELDVFLPNWRDMLAPTTAPTSKPTEGVSKQKESEAKTIPLSKKEADEKRQAAINKANEEYKRATSVDGKEINDYKFYTDADGSEKVLIVHRTSETSSSGRGTSLERNVPNFVKNVKEIEKSKGKKEALNYIIQELEKFQDRNRLLEKNKAEALYNEEIASLEETTKPTENAVQEQAAGQVPVQSEAGVSETMAEGESQAEPQVAPTEGQAEQAQAPTEEKKEVNVGDALNIINALNEQTPGQTNEAPRTYTTKNIDRAINDARKAKDAKLEKALVDAKAIMKALGKKDTKVVIHFNQGSYTQSVIQAGGEAQASGSSGFVISKDGNTIHLNLPKIKSNEVVLHEGAHPVLDWITKNNPERIDALYTELESLAQVLPGVNDAIAFSKKYGNTTQSKKEAIVQFMALVADGTINLSQANPTFKQKAIEFIKKLLQAMGIDFGVKISDDASVTELAKRFTESVKYGREISVASKTTTAAPQFSMAGYNDLINGFYSPLERTINEAKQDKMPAKQWRDKFATTEEAKWTGLQDWLSQQEGSLSKQQILDYLKDNRITVEEVVKERGKKPKIYERFDRIVENLKQKGYDVEVEDYAGMDMGIKVYPTNNLYLDIRDKVSRELLLEDGYTVLDSYEKDLELLQEANDLANDIAYRQQKEETLDETKFSQYQLEGEKKNYKEVLVTLPIKRPIKEFKWTKIDDGNWIDEESNIEIIKTNDGEFIAIIVSADENGDPVETILGQYTTLDDAKKGAEDKYYSKKVGFVKGEFKSTHFPESNILVHLRMNTRIDAEGNKVLFLEEVQSDWGQTGKKEGFGIAEKDIERLRELGYEYKDGKVGMMVGDIFVPRNYNDLVGEAAKIARKAQVGVPTAPFVMDTNAWVKLGLRVALKEAVAQGVDKIAWTTGEQQNERYDLSKQVDKIEVPFPIDNYRQVSILMNSRSGGESIDVIVNNEGKVIEGDRKYLGENIENIVGKDIAEKIMSAERGKTTTLEGDGLKIGGKGMKGFYGSIEEGSKGIVGGVSEKLFGQKVGETSIIKRANISSSDKIYEAYDNKGRVIKRGNSEAYIKSIAEANNGTYKLVEAKQLSTQPSIDVTPELQAQVQKGLPQFSMAGGVPISDVITALRNAGATEQVIVDALKQSGYYTQEEINDAMGLPGPQPTPMIQPPVTPPSFGVEPENGTNQRVNSIYERMALKAESEGNLELAAEIRRRGLYNQRSTDLVKSDSELLISSFNDDIEAAADFVMNNPINGDIRTYVLGQRATRAKQAAISNPTAENLAARNQAIYDFAAYTTDLGQATNAIKLFEEDNPDLFYLGRFSEYIATLANNLGNPAVTTTNASKVVKAAKEVVKLRKDILNKVANVISEMADDATIDSLMIDALKLDKAGKDRVLTNRMRSGLRKIAGSVESKKIIGEKLKKLADLGVFGLAETREEVKELIRRGLAEINPSLQTPLDTAEIQEMAEMFMIIYEEMATQKMDALLDKAFNGNNKNNAAVIKAVMYGALDTPNALNKFGQKFGLSYITPQMQQQLRNAAQQVANARGNAARSVAQAAFTSMFNNFIYQSKPAGYKILSSIRSFFNYFENIFYNTALFAINTFDRASQGNILRTFGNILNAVARRDFRIIADSFKDVYRKKDVSFNYTDRNGNVQSIDAKTRLVFDDVYSSLRGLPRLAEVKRAGGLNEVEIDIRNTDSRLKRRLLRTFAVPASRIMGAVDATVMPLNMFLTKRQAFYDVLKAFYKDKGIAISEAQLRTQLNDILGVDTDYISKAMEQAVVDVMGSKLWTDLGFTNTDEFPVSDPRLTTGKGSRESKIYNEFLFRTREILDSEENKRLQDSFSKMGYGGLMTPTESDLMSAAIDNYAIRVSSELAFLGTPRGSLRVPAEAISKLSNKFLPLKYAGLAPLFTNAAFNSVGMAIRVTPGLNVVQYLKYLYTSSRGAYGKNANKEFGADYEQLTKIDQNKMLRTVLLTNAAFVIAAALKPYDDKEEEIIAINNKMWTGSTPLKLTKAQTDLGYLPGRIYINGKDYDYRDNPLALLISSISFVRNFGLWSFDPQSTNFYAEDDGEIGYDPSFIETAGAYGLFITASMLELSTIKDMSKTYSDLIEIFSPPKGEDDVKWDKSVTRFLEKKGANIIRTSIPYTRFVAEMKTITDAIMDNDKKLPITFVDNIVFGHAIEDNVIKTNGYDFFGRPVKDAFTLILPFVSSVSINQDPKVDREHRLYRKMNYTPKLFLNDRLPVHITLDDLNGDANKFEDFFKRVKAEEKKKDGLVEDVERKSMTEQRILVSLPMSRQEANLVNQKSTEFAGKFVEENFINLQSMDRARFKDAMNSIYNIGREVAIYQNLGNLIEYDKADYYSMINNKIKKFKNTYVGSTMDNLSWPQEFEPSSILGDSFETQPKVIL